MMESSRIGLKAKRRSCKITGEGRCEIRNWLIGTLKNIEVLETLLPFIFLFDGAAQIDLPNINFYY